MTERPEERLLALAEECTPAQIGTTQDWNRYHAAASPDVVAALCRDNIALREALRAALDHWEGWADDQRGRQPFLAEAKGAEADLFRTCRALLDRGSAASAETKERGA